MTDPSTCDFHATWKSSGCDPDPDVCVNCSASETNKQCAKRFADEVKALLLECPAQTGTMAVAGNLLPELFLTF